MRPSEIVSIRHRTASGDPRSCWEYDPARRVVEIVLRIASAAPQALTLPVCGQHSPRIWACPIVRNNAETWVVMPARFVRVSDEEGVFILQHHMLCEALGHGKHLALTNAPPDVSDELAELVA